jgi:hypothetical protein
MPHVQSLLGERTSPPKEEEDKVKELQHSSSKQGNHLNKLLKARSTPQMRKMASMQGPLGHTCGTWGLKKVDDSPKDAPMVMVSPPRHNQLLIHANNYLQGKEGPKQVHNPRKCSNGLNKVDDSSKMMTNASKYVSNGGALHKG